MQRLNVLQVIPGMMRRIQGVLPFAPFAHPSRLISEYLGLVTNRF